VQIVIKQVSALLKHSKIGPAVDFDVLLLAIVHDFMQGECPREGWCWPRRIIDGRLPAITNIGGSALTRPGMSGSGAR
jgi:hypothetical protein